VPGMYITGAGTHPGPSVSGIPGQQAARTIIRDCRRDGVRPAGQGRAARQLRPTTPAEPPVLV
jgi:hypothetical protein